MGFIGLTISEACLVRDKETVSAVLDWLPAKDYEALRATTTMMAPLALAMLFLKLFITK